MPIEVKTPVYEGPLEMLLELIEKRKLLINDIALSQVADDYIARVKAGQATDPVLTAHLHDGWDVVTAIRGYLPHDEESAGWAAVIQWVNQDCPPPLGLDLSRVPRRPA